MAFNTVANAAAICALASNAVKAGKMGAKPAKANANTELAIKDIKDYAGDSQLNRCSDKYNEMKNIVREGDWTPGLYKAKGAITGFCKGAFEGMKDNWLTAGSAVLTLASRRNKVLKTIGLVGTGITTAWNFLANGTNLFTQKDTIEK